MHPGHWRFYDRPEEEGKGVLLAQGKQREAWRDYQQDYQHLMAYLARKRNTPEHYQVNYAQLDTHVAQVQMREHQDEDRNGQEKEELIIEPGYHGGETHLPNI